MPEADKMKIAIGADHGGFPLKEKLKSYLTDKGYIVDDCGTFGTDSVDYPKFAYAVAGKVAEGIADYGIMIDGAGIGSAMTANKVPGVRAAACYSEALANNAREHNNANLLTLGAGITDEKSARAIVDTFLQQECTVERHLRRVEMINELDKLKTINNPTVKKNSEVALNNNINNNDLEKISQRVREILNGNNSAQGTSCGTDMVCQCGVHVEKTPETYRKFMDFGVERISFEEGTGGDCVPEDIAHCIDHTILKPDATEQEIRKVCAEAREFKFASVCVSPSYVPVVAEELRGTEVKVCTVVGFPSGAHMPEIKAMETRRAIRDGAREIDMVINIGALKSRNDDLVYRDIRMVVEACEDGNAVSKVIIETAFLTDEEKVRACELAKKAKANYVKTSTGFGPGGATVNDVKLMKSVVGDAGMKVKASAGIRSYEDAEAMIKAGADRIGASASIKILQGAKGVTVSN